MSILVNLYDAKTQLSQLVERAAAGEEIIIAKAGRPRARLVPMPRIASLPPRHGDPFDRMLIVQAVADKLTIVTHDRRFEAYGVPILWT